MRSFSYKFIVLILIVTLISTSVSVHSLWAEGDVTWDTLADFSLGTNSNTSTSLSPNSVVLGLGATTTDTISDDFNLGSYVSGTMSITSTDGGEISLGNNYTFLYSGDTSPAIGSSVAIHSFLNNNLLYVSTIGGGLSVINTGGTATPADDVTVFTYTTGSTPAIGGNNVYSASMYGNLIYASTDGGLSVIDTKGTLSPSDDETLITYKTSSSPAIAGNTVTFSLLNNNLLYVAAYGNGLSVIDTKGTASTADDETLNTYTTVSTPAIGGTEIYYMSINNNLLYIPSINGGLSVVDTKGTATSADDETLIVYSTVSTPAIANSSVSHALYDNGLLYASTWSGGLSVIDTKGTASPADDETLNTYSTASTPALVGDYVRHTYKYNNLIYAVSYNGGLNVIDTNGTATASDDTLTFAYTTGSTPYIAGGLVHHVSVSGNLIYISTNGGLNVVNLKNTYFPSASFTSKSNSLSSFVPHTLSAIGTVTNDHTVSLQYRTQHAISGWSDWSSACVSISSCAVSASDLTDKINIQYKLNLATGNTQSTPIISSVTFAEGYKAQGTYTSQSIDLPDTSDDFLFSANTSIPANTGISFQYSLNGGTTWNNISSGDVVSNTGLRTFIWRAILSTTDYTITPSINSVTVNPRTRPAVATGRGYDRAFTKIDGTLKIPPSIFSKNNNAILNFIFDEGITKIAISDNINFDSATYIKATSSSSVYVKFCNNYNVCSDTKVVPINSGALPSSEKYKFTRNLSLGMVGLDVYELQKYLNSKGFTISQKGIGSKGKETTYFGSMTKKALEKFQESYAKEIGGLNGAKDKLGNFGSNTRDFVNGK